MKHYILGRDTFLSTIFVFLVTGLLGLLVINIHVFDPFKKAFHDFELTDIYYSKIQGEKTAVDTSIVVINIGRMKRDSIALMLNLVNKQHPRVVGLDAFFADQKDHYSDSLLKSAFALTKNLVLAGILHSEEDGLDHITGTNPWFGNYQRTYANLTGNEDNTNTVREFRPFFADKDSVYASFSSEIIRYTDPQCWQKLKNRNDEHEIINYTGGTNAYICLDVNDIFNPASDLSILKNKIVLLGYMGESFEAPADLEDLHFTPMNAKVSGRAIPDMRGILIHANIISMVLRDNYIAVTPAWINWLLAFVLCYLHLALFIYLYLHRHKWYHFSAKWLQFITSVVLIWLGFLFYKHFGIKLSVVPSVVVIMLSMDLLYFYEGFVTFLGGKFGFKSIFLTQNHS